MHDLWELPPRARRIQHRLSAEVVAGGTTSACAENTSLPTFGGATVRNYLRVRGEYQPNPNHYGDPLELPPRARRIPYLVDELIKSPGTTSACAENTSDGELFLLLRWNYLRVRGEYGSGGRMRSNE